MNPLLRRLLEDGEPDVTTEVAWVLYKKFMNLSWTWKEIWLHKMIFSLDFFSKSTEFIRIVNKCCGRLVVQSSGGQNY